MIQTDRKGVEEVEVAEVAEVAMGNTSPMATLGTATLNQFEFLDGCNFPSGYRPHHTSQLLPIKGSCDV